MAFNKNISGFKNEYEFILHLNNQKVRNLNPIFYQLIETLYGKLEDNNIIKCEKTHKLEKADIIITINNQEKRISIKKGIKNSVHAEGISSFIKFLFENGVKKEIIKEYLKYHYADGTINGTGINRISVEEYKKINQEKIDEINKNLNTKELLLKAINRFILTGKGKTIDAIIYGVIDDFIWITKEDIIKIILSKRNKYSTAIHFGSLTCQPMDRCLNKNPLYENRRHCIQIKWYNLGDEIIENMNNKIIEKMK